MTTVRLDPLKYFQDISITLGSQKDLGLLERPWVLGSPRNVKESADCENHPIPGRDLDLLELMK